MTTVQLEVGVGVGPIFVEKRLCGGGGGGVGGGVMWTWLSSLLSCPGVLASWLCGLRSSFVDETQIHLSGLTQESCAFLLQFRTDIFFLFT